MTSGHHVICPLLLTLTLPLACAAPTRPDRDGPTWRVWIYLAADNDLARAGSLRLEELQEALASLDQENISIAIQVDAPALPALGLPAGANATYWEGEVLRWSSKGAVDSGDPSVLHAFLREAGMRTEGEYTLLLLGGHGDGERGLLFDERPAGRMTVSGLGEALAGSHFDVLALDLCDMQSLGVAARIVPSADWIVGSVTPRPALGWSFASLTEKLSAGPPPEELARWLTEAAGASGERYGASSLRAEAIPSVESALEALSIQISKDPALAERTQRRLASLEPLTRNPRVFDLAVVLEAVESVIGTTRGGPSETLLRVVEHRSRPSTPALGVSELRLRALGLLPGVKERVSPLSATLPWLSTRREEP